MAITLKQTVKLFPEESKTDEQAVTFDPSDSWLVVSHCGNEISLESFREEVAIKLTNTI